MKKLVRCIILLTLISLFLSFLSLITQSQNNYGTDGGTFCDEGKDKYCWAQIPYWYCLPTGYYHCSDPIDKPPIQE